MGIEDLVRRTLLMRPDTRIEDRHGPGMLPGWDSLGHVRLLAAIQSQYAVKFDAKDVMQIRTLADIKRVLAEKGVPEP